MAKEKKNTKKGFKEMSREELKKELVAQREQLRLIHFKAEGAKSKNVKEALTLRKEIARIMTEVNKK